MWVIYGIDVLSNLGYLAALILIVSGIASFIYLIMCAEFDAGEKETSRLKKALTITLSAALLLVFIPDKKTMYLMVGAYATEKFVETPEAKEFGNKLLNVVNHKLDKILEEEDKKK
jgi:hypothetical protein